MIALWRKFVSKKNENQKHVLLQLPQNFDRNKQGHFSDNSSNSSDRRKTTGWIEAQAEIINFIANMNQTMETTKFTSQKDYHILKELKIILCHEVTIKKQLRTFINTNHLDHKYYSIRALIWKVSSGYFPNTKQKWISTMERNMIKYQEFIELHIVSNIAKKKSPLIKKIQQKSLNPLTQEKQQIATRFRSFSSAAKQISHHSLQKVNVKRIEHINNKFDHPLSKQKDSKWKILFESLQLWSLIQKDTIRTRTSCEFFSEQHLQTFGKQVGQFIFQTQDGIQIYPQQLHLSKSKNKEKTDYYDTLTRIIFIFCKNHPEIGYFQGMNEIAAIIFYAFQKQVSQYFHKVSESDCYFIFQMVMLNIGKSHFSCPQICSNKFKRVLQKLDKPLCQYFQELKFDISVISVKWFMSLFLNEYDIDQSLLIWDGIMIHPQQISISSYLMYMGLAIIHLNKSKILDEEINPLILFSKLSNDPRQIVEKAWSMYKIYPDIFSDEH